MITPLRARLQHPLRRNPQIEVLLERRVDQLLQRVVVKQIEPFRVGERLRVARRSVVPAKLRRHRHGGPLDNSDPPRTPPATAQGSKRQRESLNRSPPAGDSGVGSCGPRLARRRCAIRSTTTNNTGTINTASSVAAIMPPNTAVPSARREAAPAPVATSSGTTPRMNANDVIRIGRSRRLRRLDRRILESTCPPPAAASRTRQSKSRSSPPARSASRCRSACRCRMDTTADTPPAARRTMPSGTASITANGIDQLSYSAARNRNTSTAAKPKMKPSLPSESFCWINRAGPFVAEPVRQILLRRPAPSRAAWPELYPGAVCPTSCRAETVVAVNHLRSGIGSTVTSVLSGTMSPLAGAHVKSVDVVRPVAIFRLGLHHHLPGPAETVEVVHIQAAQKCLQRVVHVGDRNRPGSAPCPCPDPPCTAGHCRGNCSSRCASSGACAAASNQLSPLGQLLRCRRPRGPPA